MSWTTGTRVLMDRIITVALTYICVIYTVISFSAFLILYFFVVCKEKRKTLISPSIKPEHYKDEDLLLRKTLNALNWSLMANKAKTLYALQVRKKKTQHKNNKLTAGRNSLSFTFGSAHDYGIRKRDPNLERSYSAEI